MARKYFGTDGVRGRAGEFPLDRATVHALGRAAGRVLGRSGPSALLAMDTRVSGPGILADLAAGLALEGAPCRSAGILPTPGLAHLVGMPDFAFGTMVTASHNPFEDNGIKFFSHEGYKLPDAVEERMEEALEELREAGPPAESPPPEPEPALAEAYYGWLRSRWRGASLEGRTVVLDAANGAASAIAPRLFESLGARVVEIGCSPDGRNINLDCGSLHLGPLGEAVRASGAWMGFAFDGDADRCLAVTPGGRVLDGDFLLFHEARRRRREGELASGWVVGTVMSNLWLEKALRDEGIPFHRAPVGDRYVLESLRQRGGILGGEPSGHVLFLDQATTGDGLLTALAYAMLARDLGGADALARGISPFPQTLRNLRVGRRVRLEEDPSIQSALRQQERALGDRGRVVLRFSGTEPLLRLMVEAESQSLVDATLQNLSSFLVSHLGEGARP